MTERPKQLLSVNKIILQPKADNQGSKIPFREYRWIGPYRIEKV